MTSGTSTNYNYIQQNQHKSKLIEKFPSEIEIKLNKIEQFTNTEFKTKPKLWM